MLRQQLVRKTKKLEAEQIRRLNLELLLKDKKIKSLKKQNEVLRAENEHCRKTVSKLIPTVANMNSVISLSSCRHNT